MRLTALTGGGAFCVFRPGVPRPIPQGERSAWLRCRPFARPVSMAFSLAGVKAGARLPNVATARAGKNTQDAIGLRIRSAFAARWWRAASHRLRMSTTLIATRRPMHPHSGARPITSRCASPATTSRQQPSAKASASRLPSPSLMHLPRTGGPKISSTLPAQDRGGMFLVRVWFWEAKPIGGFRDGRPLVEIK